MRRLWIICLLALGATDTSDLPTNYVAGTFVQLNDNGAWSWFMDERAIVADGKLIVGSVRAVGDYRNAADPDWGNVEVAVYDLHSGDVRRTMLHPHFQQDDHDNPAFLALPDGRYLAVYTQHGTERRIYYRFSEPHDPLTWGPAATFDTPGDSARPLRGNNVTYSNLFRLSSGRILNFFRGVDLDPNYMYSDDTGRTWRYGGRLAHGRDGYSPYLKYAFDGRGTIHFVMTEDHPRNYDNSVYHGFVRDGSVHLSDGTRRGKLSETVNVEINAWDLTRVFQGDPDNVAWVIDLELDGAQRPCVVFSVQKDGRGLPRGQGGADHRFHYGRWDGTAWRVHEIAYAGTRLYPGEDDYTGLAALDPNDPDVVYISTDADPATGAPLMSRADGQRHRELYRGTTRDSGDTWSWEPITANSGADNLRPIVPKWRDPRTALVWMRGRYLNNHGEWTTAVVATILAPGSPQVSPPAERRRPAQPRARSRPGDGASSPPALGPPGSLRPPE
ncbi:MAG TPA: BNR-4 repeat-containing protein [Gemmatimonadales bacterium]|nr:BNR-4 repeat-containing protein [Gemmatimonadales bacterium]